jgi:hypothetical protein
MRKDREVVIDYPYTWPFSKVSYVIRYLLEAYPSWKRPTAEIYLHYGGGAVESFAS